MSDSKSILDKLSQCAIGGPSKPIIDRNLQLQLPGREDLLQNQNRSGEPRSPIYTHYIGSSPSSWLSMQTGESETCQAMEEAKRSYAAWKKMKKKIEEGLCKK